MSTTAKSIELGPVARHRSMTPEADPTPAELTEYHSGVGCLLWLAKETRVDIAAATSFAQQGKPKIKDFMNVNKLLRSARATSSSRLLIHRVEVKSGRSVIVAYGDSSWANCPDNLSSQGGCMIVLSDIGILTPAGGRFSLLDWRSSKLKRVGRSTLAAEAQSNATAADLGMFARATAAEIMTERYHAGRDGVPPGDFPRLILVTDCRSPTTC